MKLILYLISGLFCAVPLFGNGQIVLKNASFEGTPQDAIVPYGWEACGYYSTPDILPGPWGVYNRANEGNTFMGLITREEGTWEIVGQKLSTPLKEKTCYQFSVALARSPSYANYNDPIRIRIWGGNELCEKKQLLAESKTIEHYDWRTYELMMIPKESYKYIILEAYYKQGSLKPYRGNILVDAISPFKACIRAQL